MDLFKLACFFFFCRCIFRSGIAESCGGCSFRFLRTVHTVFLSGCINLHSHNDLQEFPFLGNLINILLFVNFLMIAILTVCDFDIHFPDDYNWISLLKGVVNKRQHLVSYSQVQRLVFVDTGGQDLKGAYSPWLYTETRKSR